MDKRTFDRFREIVLDLSGISLGEQKEALVSARVGKRMRVLNITTHEAYIDYIAEDSSGQELVHLIDAISTNVTSFFRENDHFTFLTDIIKKWHAEGQRRFRVWSAASSTGEEPYSLAITLLEALDPRSVDMRILATDISTRVLEMCRIGRYGKERMKTVPAAVRDRYFDRISDNGQTLYSAKKALRDITLFRRLNLSTPPFPMKGPLDVVFCRNVMIYFDTDVRTKLLTDVHRLLRPGGYLMVGHAESLTGIPCQLKYGQAVHLPKIARLRPRKDAPLRHSLDKDPKGAANDRHIRDEGIEPAGRRARNVFLGFVCWVESF